MPPRSPTKKRRAEAEAAAPPEPAIRRGPLTALLPLLALGAGVAVYMTVAHLQLFHGTGSFKSICNFGAHLSCDAVNTSAESEIGGVAIAVLALPAYAMIASLVREARGAEPTRARQALVLAHALAWPAVAYTLYLLAVMVFKLGTLCLFCLTLDTVNVAAFALTARAARATPLALVKELAPALAAGGRRLALIAGGVGAAVLAVGLAGHAWLRASLEAEARQAVVLPAADASGSAEEPSGAASGGPELAGAKKLPSKRWPVPVDADDASVGPLDAKVTVVEFADFQCGYCRKLEQGLAAVRKTYAREVRFVFKHFPMNPRCNPGVQNEKHKYACEAAVSAECARVQGKFWPMHDALYEHQSRLERADLDARAAEVGLEPAAFAACMDSPTAAAAVTRDAQEGSALKVAGTPRTFVNGRLFAGVLSEDLLDFVIRVELGRVTGKAAEFYAPPPGASAAPPPGPE